MLIAFIKKLLGIHSPSAEWHGYDFEYDWLKNRDKDLKELDVDIKKIYERIGI